MSSSIRSKSNIQTNKTYLNLQSKNTLFPPFKGNNYKKLNPKTIPKPNPIKSTRKSTPSPHPITTRTNQSFTISKSANKKPNQSHLKSNLLNNSHISSLISNRNFQKSNLKKTHKPSNQRSKTPNFTKKSSTKSSWKSYSARGSPNLAPKSFESNNQKSISGVNIKLSNNYSQKNKNRNMSLKSINIFSKYKKKKSTIIEHNEQQSMYKNINNSSLNKSVEEKDSKYNNITKSNSIGTNYKYSNFTLNEKDTTRSIESGNNNISKIISSHNNHRDKSHNQSFLYKIEEDDGMVSKKVIKKIRCMHDLSKTGMCGNEKKVNQDTYFIFQNFCSSSENKYLGIW